jgi:hypothetical protein
MGARLEGMAATPGQRDDLTELDRSLRERAPLTKAWRDSLYALRVQSKATSAVLSGLAATPPDAPPRAYVDLVLVSPRQQWAEDVAQRLRDALPKADIKLGEPGERLPGAPDPVLYTVSCAVAIPEISAGTARKRVLSALGDMPDIETDYSEPIDLIVVKPLLA